MRKKYHKNIPLFSQIAILFPNNISKNYKALKNKASMQGTFAKQRFPKKDINMYAYRKRPSI
ncbi:MAG: hypothetical protein BGO69_06005 [Bacteroidetes bacterium 46-16]|nr:MAG: hypothetical protein BGO69_06005 [Bacteroidetes bacterium 46-16]